MRTPVERSLALLLVVASALPSGCGDESIPRNRTSESLPTSSIWMNVETRYDEVDDRFRLDIGLLDIGTDRSSIFRPADHPEVELAEDEAIEVFVGDSAQPLDPVEPLFPGLPYAFDLGSLNTPMQVRVAVVRGPRYADAPNSTITVPGRFETLSPADRAEYDLSEPVEFAWRMVDSVGNDVAAKLKGAEVSVVCADGDRSIVPVRFESSDGKGVPSPVREAVADTGSIWHGELASPCEGVVRLGRRSLFDDGHVVFFDGELANGQPERTGFGTGSGPSFSLNSKPVSVQLR